MALAPHYLDEVFTNPKKFEHEFKHHPKVQAAFRAAESAFQEQAAAFAEHPGLMGGGPEQMARVAFLSTLGLSEQTN